MRFPTNGIVALLGLFVACAPPSTADMDSTRGGRMDVYFNDPGTRADNMWNPDVIDVMVDMIDNAQSTIDFAVMGFNRRELSMAFERAYDRGIQVRMVGDAGHLYNSGYQMMLDRHIPMVVGNDGHIMHNKFMVVDGRFVFGGTANWTDTDLVHNSNNFFTLDHPDVAADFTAEFEQMFRGAFGHTKKELLNGRSYQVEDTLVEVWFSPNEDSVGRILELVDGAKESIRFTIFAFTKDQVGSSFIRLQDRLRDQGVALGGDPESDDFRGITGVIDRSQLHSNGQYHEVFRLLGDEAVLRMDGNDNSQQPGDYQAGGGRLHSKTMIIDAGGENPVVISGSFNWSSSATVSNDEYLIVMHGKRVADAYMDYYASLWKNGKKFGLDFIGEEGTGDTPLNPGDLLINEVQWYGGYNFTDNGLTYADPDGNDEFIELYNTTDRPIALDMWQIANQDDFIMGFPPGSTVLPKSTFLILDHQLEAYQDGAPQDQVSAYRNGDLVLNVFNDNRQARLYLKDGELELILKDPNNRVMDRAGNATPAYHGGPENGGVVRSMERKTNNPGTGTEPGDWQECSLSEGGANVNEMFRSRIRATPGEPNSGL